MRGSDYRGDEPPPGGESARGGGRMRGREAPMEAGAEYGQRPRRGWFRGRGMPVETEYRKPGRHAARGERYEAAGEPYETRGEPYETRGGTMEGRGTREYGEVRERPMAESAEAREMAEQEWGSPIVGMLTAAAGIVILLTTFMTWIRGLTGWDLMAGTEFTGGTLQSNFLWRVPSGRSLLVFTGFWSLLIGVLMVVSGLLMIWRHRSGGSLATLFGAIGTAIGVWNLVNIYVLRTGFRVPGVTIGGGNIVPGIGIWLFTIISFIALIHGILGAEGVDNPTNDRLSYGTLPSGDMGRGRPAMR